MNKLERAEAVWLTPPETMQVCECEHCAGELYEGDTIYKYDNMDFCSKDCIIEHMVNNGDIEEIQE
jgi:hypothetical protein